MYTWKTHLEQNLHYKYQYILKGFKPYQACFPTIKELNQKFKNRLENQDTSR